MNEARTEVDAATVEIIRNYLTSAATEMQRTLIRTAYNTIIYEILDFGISMYDRNANLIADSPGLPVFLGANDAGLRASLDHLGEENLNEGDIVVVNYPYWSGTHTLDVLLFMPVFYEDDLIGYTTSRAHWLDIGAKDSGYVLDSTDIHQEGVIFPGTKVYKDGEPDEEILDLIRYNSRIPDKVIGDLNAQIAALRTGEERMKELYKKYGANTVESAIDRIIDHGETSAREAVESLPDGTWTAVDYADGIYREDDDLIRMEAEVTIEEDEFTVDFSGSSDAVDEPLNIPIGTTKSISKLAFKTVTTPAEDSNHGQYEPLNVVAPEGNIYNAQYPSPTFTIWTAIVGINVIFKALAKALPEQVPASSGGDLCDIMLYGEHPDTGRQFVEALNEGVGWGGTADHDGQNALMHVTETMVRNIPIEVFENKAPIEFDRLELREDSGGAGRHRGGLGIRRDYRITHPVGALSIIQKTKTEGWGLKGGKPGAKNVVALFTNEDNWDERIEVLVDNDDLHEKKEGEAKFAGMFRGTFQPGEVISNRSGGGGGFGNPYRRDPKKVREDVIDGYVSREAAREEYGVVITSNNVIDWDKTEKLRTERNE